MFHLIWSVIIGFIIGLIARAIVPGAQSMGFVMTTVLGIVGSLIGGVIGGIIKKPQPGQKFHPAGFILSIIGAIVCIYILKAVR